MTVPTIGTLGRGLVRRTCRVGRPSSSSSSSPPARWSPWSRNRPTDVRALMVASMAATTGLAYVLSINPSDVAEDDAAATTAGAVLCRDIAAAAAAASDVNATMSEPSTLRRQLSTQMPGEEPPEDRPRLIFLGTGSSTGCPKPICAMTYEARRRVVGTRGADDPPASASSTGGQGTTAPQQQQPKYCHVSNVAIRGDPKTNKNYRNNPSLLIHHRHGDDGGYKNIVVDVGKTFRETALRWFPEHGISSLDAIVLTHHHMDAAAGLDDVRGFQSIRWIQGTGPLPEEGGIPGGTVRTGGGGGGPPLASGKDGSPRPTRRPVRAPVPLYMSDFCHTNLRSQFPWLLPAPEVEMPRQDANRPDVRRDVASFDVTIFEDYKTETVKAAGGFRFTPLPVWHGDDLISHGFAFTLHDGPTPDGTDHGDGGGRRSNTDDEASLNVVYLSDISRMVPETLDFIRTQLPPTDVLIVDSLLWDKDHPVHFSLEQAVGLSQIVQPRVRTYLIGMSCDDFLPHEEMNAYLHDRYGGKVQMAHDGLTIELPRREQRSDGKMQQ